MLGAPAKVTFESIVTSKRRAARRAAVAFLRGMRKALQVSLKIAESARLVRAAFVGARPASANIGLCRHRWVQNRGGARRRRRLGDERTATLDGRLARRSGGLALRRAQVVVIPVIIAGVRR